MIRYIVQAQVLGAWVAVAKGTYRSRAGARRRMKLERAASAGVAALLGGEATPYRVAVYSAEWTLGSAPTLTFEHALAERGACAPATPALGSETTSTEERRQ